MTAAIDDAGMRPLPRQGGLRGWRGATLGVVLAAAGCAGPEDDARDPDPEPQPEEAQQVAFDVLAQGDRPAADVGPNAVGVRIIESADDFARAHRALAGGEAPAVDFDRSVVLALYMGRQPSGGHRMQVESVVRTQGKLTVHVVSVEPGPACLVTQAVTRPYQLVRVPVETGEPIDVERSTVQRDCG